MTAFTATRALTEDVISALEGDGLTVGDADGAGLTVPYVVVFPIQGTLDGTLGNPDEDAMQSFQLTSVGETRRQAEWVRDKARAVTMAGISLTVAGQTLMRTVLDIDSGVRRDDDAEPSVFIAQERFRLMLTPTTV